MAAWNNQPVDGPKLKVKNRAAQKSPKENPNSLWQNCPKCAHVLFKAHLKENLHVCTKCRHHMQLSAQERAHSLLDRVLGSLGEECLSYDWLKFTDTVSYADRLKKAQQKTGLSEALLVQYGEIKGQKVVLAVFDFDFIGGSMGSAVGERFVQAVHYAIKQRYPLICVASSGGARMQESLYSLMQMSKTAAALAKLSQTGLGYIVVLASPCMGGVSASLATLGDLLIAEPRAMIGFTGRRVIEQTVKGTLPQSFQESEFLLQHGAIDMIVDRRDLKETLARFLRRLAQGVY